MRGMSSSESIGSLQRTCPAGTYWIEHPALRIRERGAAGRVGLLRMGMVSKSSEGPLDEGLRLGGYFDLEHRG